MLTSQEPPSIDRVLAAADAPRHAPVRRAASSARVALLLLAAAAASPACEVDEIAAPRALTLLAGDERTVQGYGIGSVARIGVEFALTNTGPSAAVYDIAVQAQTTGDPDVDACGELRGDDPRPFPVGAEGDPLAPLQTLRELDRAHLVEPVGSPAEVSFAVRIRTAGVYRLYLPAGTPATLADADGNLQPVAGEWTTACTLPTRALLYDVNDGTFTLRLPAQTSLVLLSRDCADQRRVPGTCPGHAGEVVRAEPIRLEPGEQAVDVLAARRIGVGDLAVVDLACNDFSPDCAADLQVFVATEPLACRADADCRTNESCDDNGYCERPFEASCASSRGTPGGAAFAATAALLALASSRRRVAA